MNVPCLLPMIVHMVNVSTHPDPTCVQTVNLAILDKAAMKVNCLAKYSVA